MDARYGAAGSLALAVNAWAHEPAKLKAAAAPAHAQAAAAVQQLEGAVLALSSADAARLLLDPELDLPRALTELCAGSPQVAPLVLQMARSAVAHVAARPAAEAVVASVLPVALDQLSSPQEPRQLCAAEFLFTAAHTVPAAPPLLLTLRCVTGLIGALTAPGTAALPLYHTLAVVHRLCHTEPRDHAHALLTSRNLHTALLGLLQANQEVWHATAKGMALHILAALLGHAPALLAPHMGAPFVAGVVVPALRSEWSEVLEGALLFTAALAPAGTAATFFDALIAQHDAHHVVAASLVSGNTRVAAAAAHCLRCLLVWCPPAHALGAQLLSHPATVAALLTVACDGESAEDATGHRILQSEVALCLCLALAHSAANRRHFAADCAERGIDVRSVSVVLTRLLRQLHLSVFHGWVLVDATGTALSRPPADVAFDPVAAVGVPSDAVARILRRQEDREAGRPAPEPAAHAAPSDLATAALVRAVLHRAATLVIGAGGRPEDHDPAAPGTAQHHGPDDACVSAASYARGAARETMYERGFQLATRFAKHYRAGPRPTTKPAAKTASAARPKVAKTSKAAAWAPPAPREVRRQWGAEDVQQRDLFVFEVVVDAAPLGATLGRVLAAAVEHLEYINAELQMAPIAHVTRRCLLGDLFVNVLPRVVSCLEYLVDAAAAPTACDALHVVLAEGRWRAIDCGNLAAVCSALATSTGTTPAA